MYSRFLRNVEYLNNNKDNNESLSSESSSNFRKKRARQEENNQYDFTIVIDKSILNDFPQK